MRRQTLLLLLTLLAGNSFAQITGDFREMFLEAESYFLFEEYIEAMPYYTPLNEQYPDNDNINYKIGVCLLNDPYNKDKSIAYLEKASQNISEKYKENSFRETSAPLEVLFYLGNAYRINGELDRAILTYESFKRQADPELYDLDLVDEQIMACNNAKELQSRPIDFDISNPGDRINTRHSDVNPVISGDETKIVYIQKQAFFDALAYCEKIDGVWSFPRILMQEMAVDEDAYPTALNYEGDELIIYRSDNFIGDLYTSKYVDGFWTPPVRMNDNINTKYWESHACFTKSGDTLYFTSNRKGTYGGLDIYYSVRGEDGEWGIPVNLGPTINTRYNEETPFITEDGKTLYFSSYGHYNMGGYDVFYSTKLDSNEWSVPVNAGYPINTTDDDIFFNPVRNGTHAYYPRLMDGGLGKTDIYHYEIYSASHPRKFQVSGILGITDLEQLSSPLMVSVVSQSTGDTVAVAMADSKTGEFNFEAPAGKYDLLVEGEDIESTSREFEIPEGFKDKELAVKQSIMLDQAEYLLELWARDDIIIEDTLIIVNNPDTVKIEMELERTAKLFVNIFHSSVPTGRDTFEIVRRSFTYPYLPVPGENLIQFELIDEKDIRSYKDVTVVYVPPEPEPEPEVVVKEEPEIQLEEGLEDYLERLTGNSSGGLQNFLSGIELAALGIVSIDQLNNYLIQQAATEDYSEEEVRRLMAVTPVDQEQATETLRTDLAELSEGELQEVLLGLDLEEEGIGSEEELIYWLRDHVDEHNYTRQDVHDLVITNVQADYVDDYRNELHKISENEGINKALDDVDLSELASLQELYEYLLSESEAYGYSADDVNQMFGLLAQQEELNELHTNLTEMAEGDLLVVLKELDTRESGIDNSVELISYLISEAEYHEYSEEDVMVLLLDYLEEEDLREVVNLLIGASSGELQNLLLNLDTGQNNINNIDDLYDYLIEQAKFHDYSEDDVIKLFLNMLKIVEQEPIVDEIPVVELIKPEKKAGRAWLFILLGGVGIAILIFLFVRRKKSDKEEESV